MINAEYSAAHLKLHAFNRVLSIVLRTGIAVSLLLMAGGLVLYAIQGDTTAGRLIALPILFAEVLKFNPSAFVTIGLMVMLLMPPAILIASFIYFIKAGERKPLITCSVLLLMLIASLVAVLLLG